jgi:hypothetical protein
MKLYNERGDWIEVVSRAGGRTSYNTSLGVSWTNGAKVCESKKFRREILSRYPFKEADVS